MSINHNCHLSTIDTDPIVPFGSQVSLCQLCHLSIYKIYLRYIYAGIQHSIYGLKTYNISIYRYNTHNGLRYDTMVKTISKWHGNAMYVVNLYIKSLGRISIKDGMNNISMRISGRLFFFVSGGGLEFRALNT